MEKKRIVFELVLWLNETYFSEDEDMQTLATKEEIESKFQKNLYDELTSSEIENVSVRVKETIGFTLPSKF